MEDRKYFEMLVLFCFTFTVGISLAGIGPVLPDLMCLWNVSLHTISFLFLIAGVGTLAAIVVSSLLMEKLPAFIVLAIITITRGLAMFLFPYTGGLALAGPVVFIYGTTNGLSAVGSLYTTNLLWPTRAETIHLIQSGVAIGATLTPLLEKPFLSDGLFTIMMQGTPNDNPKQQFGDNNVTFNSSEITVSPDRSMAMLTGETMLDNAIYTNVTFYNPLNESLLNATFDSVNLFLTEAEANNSSWCYNFSTFLDFPFILFGCIAIPVTVGLIICYRRGKNSQDHPTNPYTSIDKSTDTSQSCIQHMFVILMCLFSLFSMAIVGCISNLLATFGTECALKVDLNTTSNMTSVFWIFYSLGRIVPYFFIDRVRTFPILSVSFVGMTAGVVMLFLSLYNGLVSLWISMILLGFFSGPNFSSLFTWTRDESDVPERATNIRDKIFGILHCDIRNENPFSPNFLFSVDIITSSFCLETVATDLASYEGCARNVVGMLKPGGCLVMVGSLGGTYYTVGEKTFRCFGMSIDDLKSTWQKVGIEIISWYAVTRPEIEPEFTDIDGCYCMVGKKVPETL